MSMTDTEMVDKSGWWELKQEVATGYWYLWAQPTRVKILRVGAPGVIHVWDKKAKCERPLTVQDLVNFWTETRTR